MSVMLVQQGFIPALAVQVGDDDETRMVSNGQQDIYEAAVDGACIAEIGADGSRLVIGIIIPPIGLANKMAKFAAGSADAVRSAQALISSDARRESLTCEQGHKAFKIGKWIAGGVALGLGIAALISTVATGGLAAIPIAAAHASAGAIGAKFGGWAISAAEKLVYKTWCETYQVAFEKCLAAGSAKGLSTQENADVCLEFIKGELEGDAADDQQVNADPTDLPKMESRLKQTMSMIEDRLDSNWYLRTHVKPLSFGGRTPTARFGDPPDAYAPNPRSRYQYAAQSPMQRQLLDRLAGQWS